MRIKAGSALILVLACLTNLCPAQSEFQVSKPRLSIEDNQLLIGYDLQGNPEVTLYSIRVEVTGASGKTIPVQTLAGDVGEQIVAGNNRRIVWDLAADSIYLDEEISVRVIARAFPIPEQSTIDPDIMVRENPGRPVDTSQVPGRLGEDAAEDEVPAGITEDPAVVATVPAGVPEDLSPAVEDAVSFSRAGILLQSVALPGLGLSRIYRGKPHWLKGVAGYGLMGGAIYLNIKAVSSYESYRNAGNPEDVDNHFNRAVRQDRVSELLAYTAIGVWVTDLVWTYVATSGNRMVTQELHRKKFSLGAQMEPVSAIPLITLQYSFGLNID